MIDSWLSHLLNFPDRRGLRKRRRRLRRQQRFADSAYVETLEHRTLLSALAPNPFAEFDGEIEVAGEPSIVSLQVDDSNFNFPHGRIILGFNVEPPEGSSLSVEPISINTEDQECFLPPGFVRLFHHEAGNGSTLAALRPNEYQVIISGEGDSTGAWTLDVFLAGDANGDFRVDSKDHWLILQELWGHPSESPLAGSADSNQNGRIDFRDAWVSFMNTGAATDIRPLAVTVGLDLVDVVDPPGGNTTNHTPVTVSGQSSNAATILLDVDGDGFDDGTFMAQAPNQDSNYEFTVDLVDGNNTIFIQAIDAFGQVATTSIVITLDTSISSSVMTASGPVTESFEFGNQHQSTQEDTTGSPHAGNCQLWADHDFFSMLSKRLAKSLDSRFDATWKDLELKTHVHSPLPNFHHFRRRPTTSE